VLRLLMVHGSPSRINEYLFEDRPERSFARMIEDAGADVLLFGHTHKPFHKVLPYEADGKTRYRHAINIGSVGKPKDGDARACYVLLHLAEDPSPLRAVEESPLPDAFADMLRKAY
jgi:diadenosine tetraphosphatase ApaH/serine/threonine PP2A family protein phosphatase